MSAHIYFRLCIFLMDINLSFSVTQIPLDSPRPDGTQTKIRPPWIRPVRKKTTRSSASNDGASQHSSPEAFPPSDVFLDMSGRVASPPPHTSFPASSNGVAYVLGNGTPGPSFLPSDGMDMSGDPALSMNPSDLLAMFGDGSLDVNTLLMSPQQKNVTSPYFGSLGDDDGVLAS